MNGGLHIDSYGGTWVVNHLRNRGFRATGFSQNDSVTLRIDQVTDSGHPHVPAVARLLEDTFPEWERESMAMFWADLRAGRGLELWVLTDDAEQFLGFARGCCLPENSRGWIVHLALEPGQRGAGRGEAFLLLLRDHLRERVPKFEGLYFEVERVEDSAGATERGAREKRLAFFARLGARVVTTGYVQPPSQPGQPPVPLNLLFWGETVADNLELVLDFYQTAFQYDEDHPHVRMALAQVVNPA